MKQVPMSVELAKLQKKLSLPGDARSSRGIAARGKTIYKGGALAPHRGNLSLAGAIKRRLMNGAPRTP